MNAVGGDDGVRGYAGALSGPVLEGQLNRAVLLLHPDAALVEVQDLGRQVIAKQSHEIRPMRHIAIGTVQLAASLHALHGKHPPILPAAEFPGGLQPHGKGFELPKQPESLKRPRHVRGHHYSGPGLTQLGNLLVDRCINPRLSQEQRRCKPAQPAADDGNPQAHVATTGK